MIIQLINTIYQFLWGDLIRIPLPGGSSLGISLLILLLIPLLVVAYIRDKNARLIKKEREQDEEERRKIEESIDNKSVQEIEAEIRAELEKEKLIKEKEEQKDCIVCI